MIIDFATPTTMITVKLIGTLLSAMMNRISKRFKEEREQILMLCVDTLNKQVRQTFQQKSRNSEHSLKTNSCA